MAKTELEKLAEWTRNAPKRDGRVSMVAERLSAKLDRRWTRHDLARWFWGGLMPRYDVGLALVEIWNEIEAGTWPPPKESENQ